MIKPDAVALLETLLRLAREGKIHSLAVIARNDVDTYTLTSKDSDFDELLVGSVALTRYIRKRRRDAKASR